MASSWSIETSRHFCWAINIQESRCSFLLKLARALSWHCITWQTLSFSSPTQAFSLSKADNLCPHTSSFNSITAQVLPKWKFERRRRRRRQYRHKCGKSSWNERYLAICLSPCRLLSAYCCCCLCCFCRRRQRRHQWRLDRSNESLRLAFGSHLWYKLWLILHLELAKW